jgi:transmembrane sensor
MTDRESSSEIQTEAIRWVWRLDREGRSPDLLAALDEWLAADERRRGALLQAEATFALLDAGRNLQADSVDTQQQAAAAAPQIERPPAYVSRRKFIAGGFALAASAAGGAVAWVLREHFAGFSQRYGTMRGEIRRLPLPDGSTVAINTLSNVEVKLTSKERLVDVTEGEAWFHVAKDPARPFLVTVGALRARAVGTAFAVKHQEHGAEVLVTEGTVETWLEGAEARVVRATAGTKVFVVDNASIASETTASADIDRSLAWLTGKISLSGETFAEAAAEFNRYNARKLLIPDPAIAQKRFYGVFRIDDPEGFARAASQSLDVQVIDDQANIIIAAKK